MFQNHWFYVCCFYSSHRNVMMRLNLQLTMGSFSLTLFGLIGVAFGMNLTTAFEDVRNFAVKYNKYTSVGVLLFLLIFYYAVNDY